MHTHFFSATNLLSTFLGVLVAGTVWRLGWLRIGRLGVVKNSRVLAGFARAALGQY